VADIGSPKFLWYNFFERIPIVKTVQNVTNLRR